MASGFAAADGFGAADFAGAAALPAAEAVAEAAGTGPEPPGPPCSGNWAVGAAGEYRATGASHARQRVTGRYRLRCK